MKARRLMFNKWKNLVANGEGTRLGVPAIFIDGRMTVESFQIFAVTPDKIEDYEQHLFSDADVQDPICSLKATSHIGAQIASQMVQIFTNYTTNYNMGDEIRDVPFQQAYEAIFLTRID
jgi:hypothetical protein